MVIGNESKAGFRPRTTEPVPLGTLVARSDGRLIAGATSEVAASEVAVTGATLRGQDVQPGDLFAGVAGARVHGAQFADQAVAAGAVAILTDPEGAEKPQVKAAGVPVVVHDDPRGVLGEIAAWIYDEPSLKLNVIGVTGTSGKTTTTYMVDAGLRAAGRTTGLVGTVETRVAGERLPSAFTTPEAPDLQAMFASMAERGVTDVAMEVSSHALSFGRVNGTRFAVGAFTNLSQDHLDFHRDMQEYFAAKAMLFDGRSTTEVVTVDSAWGQSLVTPQTVTVALDPSLDAAWTATEVTSTPTGEQSFVVHGPDGVRFSATLPLPGAFNVANALLAAAMLDVVGVAQEHIVEGLASVQVPGRMERVDVGQPFTAVVDYAHKPAAVTLALDALRAQTEGKVITVLGCGGDRDRGKRPLMGEAAARRSDVLIITDDNPRSEDPADIRRAMLDGARAVAPGDGGQVLEIGDRGEAIAHAVSLAGPGDAVFVGGKGHESGQEIHGVKHPFSDRDELIAALARLRKADGDEDHE